MYRTLLVPLDGSALAERALTYGATLARLAAAQLVLVRAALARSLPGVDDSAQQVHVVREAETYLDAVATLLRAEGGADVETGVFYGPATEAILGETRSRRADLVVMATHGRSGLGRWLYGSVADEVLRQSPVPVFLVPADAATPPWPEDRPGRVLVPLDGSSFAREALPMADAFATATGAHVTLLRVIDPNDRAYPEAFLGAKYDLTSYVDDVQRELEVQAQTLRLHGHTVTVHAQLGNPAFAVAEAARQQRADIIAMATHGRSGLARMVLGSVASSTLRRAGIPLLLVRPAALSREPLPMDEHKAVATLSGAG